MRDNISEETLSFLAAFPTDPGGLLNTDAVSRLSASNRERLGNLCDAGYVSYGRCIPPNGDHEEWRYALTVKGVDALAAKGKELDRLRDQAQKEAAQRAQQDAADKRSARRSWWQFWLGLVLGWILGSFTARDVLSWLVKLFQSPAPPAN